MALLLAAPLAPEAASGQVVEGQLTDLETSQPIPDAFVVLVSDAGEDVFRAVTDAEGRFVVRAAADGAYTLRAERVGFTIRDTVAVRVADGAAAAVDYRVTQREVGLSGLPVGASSCTLDDEAVATLWREAVKALHAAVWTAEYRPLRYDIRLFERIVGPGGVRVAQEDDSVLTDLRAVPFAAGDPRAIRDSGYVRRDGGDGLTFFPVDPAGLLTDAFPAGRCFRVTGGGDGGSVALAFDAAARPGAVDVAGTMWFGEGGGLRRIEYRYVGEGDAPRVEGGGGWLSLAALSGADWVVTGWRIRMPVFADSAGGPAGFTEVGGHVTKVASAEAGVLYAQDAVSVLRGIVHDSTSGGPLAGAAVAVVGTDLWAATDSAGEFFLAGALDGDYAVVFGNPRLDSLGFVSSPRRVTLRPGSEAVLDLAVPSVATILGGRCQPESLAGERRVLHGVVRDAPSGAPVPGAVVSVMREELPEELRRLGLPDLDATAVTDSLGRYTLCGVPVGQTIVINAADRERYSDFVAVSFTAEAVRFDRGEPMALAQPVARLDLAVVSGDEHGHVLSGMVTDAVSDEGIAGATVQVDGTRLAARTDSSGVFRLEGVPAGMLRLIVRRIGYDIVRSVVDFTGGGSMVVGSGVFAMRPTDALVLEPITVEAEGVAPKLTGFEQRRSSRFGSYMDREQIEDARPSQASDILRRMRGIRVIPNPLYGSGGDTRRWLLIPSRDIGQRVTRIIETNAERATTGLADGAVVSECPVLLFLDGVYMGDSRDTDVDTMVTPTSLVGVEVYSPSQVPAEFALPGSTCGVAVFWTR